MATTSEYTTTNYPSDVSDVSEAEWEFCAPYLTLMRPDAPQRDLCMRAVFSAAPVFEGLETKRRIIL